MVQLVSTFDAAPGTGVTELPTPAYAAAQGFPDEWFYGGFFSQESSAGIRVSPNAALSHCPFWQGINVIAGDIGQLPVRVQRRERSTGMGADKWQWAEVDDSPIEWLLNEEPNDFQTPALFKETLQLWSILFGNGCALIDWDRMTGQPVELFPLFPERLTCLKVNDGEYILRYSFYDGTSIWIDPSEIIHIRGLATDGFWGKSAVEVAASVLGLGIAAREHAANTLRNGGRPSGTIETTHESLDDSARAKFRSEWMAVHGGARGAGVPAILPLGWKYAPNAMSNAELALLELMKLDREQVASLLNLPPHKLNAMENAAVRANVAEGNRAYFSGTLARHANQWGEELKAKLIHHKERRSTRYRVTLDATTLTEGNSDDLMNRAVKGVRGKLLTRNEGRGLIGRNPVEDGDEFENPATSTGEPGSDDDSTVETVETVEDMQAELAAIKEQLRLSEATAEGLRAENTKLRG
jgi:HK97 family phage portal protein